MKVYQEIIDFYEKVLVKREAFKPLLPIQPAEMKEETRDFRIKEGSPLIRKADFIIDIPSSIGLFEAICHIGKGANEKMRENIQAVEEAISINAINLRQLFQRHFDETHIEKIAKEFNIDKAVLKFLIHESIKPSLDANVDKLKDRVDLKNWLRGYCPICGSAPFVSVLKGEGHRYFQCSFCLFQWPGERLRCPFCESADREKLHYFYSEGNETHRVDLCDNCHSYIKTVDSRKLGYEPDLVLEDIITIHLDIVASEKGYKRPAASSWGV